MRFLLAIFIWGEGRVLHAVQSTSARTMGNHSVESVEGGGYYYWYEFTLSGPIGSNCLLVEWVIGRGHWIEKSRTSRRLLKH